MESHEPRARDRAVERPLIGKCNRRFLLVTVATFVFWVALIYVFNRDVVVKHEIVISSLVGMHDQGDSDHATAPGMDSNHPPKVVEKPGENIVQKFGSDGSGAEAEVRQPPRIDATGDGSTEELDHSASAREEPQQPPVNIARRNGSDEERIDGKLTDDQVAQHPIRNETGGSSEPVNGTRPDEETQQPRRNVADGQGGGGSDEDQANDTDSGKASADETVKEEVSLSPERDSCDGRYIFVQILPRRFHSDLLRNCKSLSAWTDMCETLSNRGLGPELPGTAKALSETGWFSTNQFSLEVIFHNRMKQYKCLTKDSSVASAIYVPYYAGLDVARYLWHSTEYRDVGPRELVRWLRARPEWKRMAGKDHFLVAGRVSWDFRRETANDSDWGTNLLVLPEVERMTSLVLESTLIPSATDFAIPYPTYFHPSSDADVIRWQNRMRKLKRRFLFSFAGARRPNLSHSIRDEIIDQCRASRSKCKLLECYTWGNSCDRPQNLIRLFQRSVFCLQPQGDSYTRRSTFDSILTGCIPVFFHSGSAYDQYKWHLPSDYRKYSVFIPEGDVKKGKVDIERVLIKIPRSKVEEMREAVIELIPKVLYADPRSELEKFEDAFDLAVKEVLARINNIVSRGT